MESKPIRPYSRSSLPLSYIPPGVGQICVTDVGEWKEDRVRTTENIRQKDRDE